MRHQAHLKDQVVLITGAGRGIGKRLAIGWSMGTLVSALGVYLSLQLDLPTGATIVCVFGISLVLCGILRKLLGVTGTIAGSH